MGGGLPGVKGHNPPREFSDQRTCGEPSRDLNYQQNQSEDSGSAAGCTFDVDVGGKGPEPRTAVSGREEDFYTENTSPAPPQLPSDPHKERKQEEKMLSRFHAWQNFLWVQTDERRRHKRGEVAVQELLHGIQTPRDLLDHTIR